MATQAMQAYNEAFGTVKEEGEFVGFERHTVSKADQGIELVHDVEAPPAASVATRRQRKQKTRTCTVTDSDGEDMLMCPQCRLPIGEVAYLDDEVQGAPVHGECMAQFVQHKMNDEEQTRKQQDAAQKQKNRENYGIGWKAESIPSNVGPATKLGCYPVPQGMSCLVLEEDTVGLAATLEPAESVNFEYLSLALQVRLAENREPYFSLDPTDKSSMQAKVYEPAWLAGTSVGDVLFQADYHLKELSMGEYEQPVVGMKSCFDFYEMSGRHEKEWTAREWFVVRKAEMQLTENNHLIPQVKMAVEAREQIMSAEGMEDAPLTKPNHPLVKYAEEFSKNFELIAERKSVIFHLRELAKASVMAKFLVEAQINLADTWFDLAAAANETCCLEVPQLWNDRVHSQIQVKDGKISEGEVGKKHGVYGGVDFGLDKFSFGGPPRAMAPGMRPSAQVVAAHRAPMALSAAHLARPGRRLASAALLRPSLSAVGQVPAARAAALRPSAAMAPRAGVSMAPRAGVSAMAPRAAVSMGRAMMAPRAGVSAMAPRGVDLNLDEFNLTGLTRVTRGDWSSKADATVAIGEAFWAGLEEKSVLSSIFNSNLCDRRAEGDKFVPPDTSSVYVQKLCNLLKDEAAADQKRKAHFFSEEFVTDAPGALFPASWASSCKVAGKSHLMRKTEEPMLEQLLKSAAPSFEKSTEDATKFRIYRIGSLEVRTTQEATGKEVVGAVFSVSSSPHTFLAESKSVDESEQVVKVTEFVEKREKSLCFYVVLETAQGNMVVTEKLQDGTVAWQSNPMDLEDRNSLAKVLRSSSCENVTVGAAMGFQAPAAAHSERKQYAQAAYGACRGA